MTAILRRPSRASAITLLERADLPIQDLTDAHLEHFFYAGEEATPLGIIGLELSAPHGLLRSLAVAEHARRRGLGAELLAEAEKHARSQGVRELYLLTTTAESFFAAHGYTRIARDTAPAFISASTEFTTLCPASAAFMVKMLEEPSR